MAKYLTLIKFSHTVFALPFAAIGFCLALAETGYAEMGWRPALAVLLCMLFARSAAMAFNRYADRHIDKENPRTSGREIPANKIKPASVLVFTVLNAIAFVATTLFINDICFHLSPLALLIILGYSYTKRFTALSHFILGVGLGLAPIGAYLAVAGKFELLPLLFSTAVLLWVSGFDIIYALQDVDFDKQAKLKSIPSQMGNKNALRASAILHVLCMAALCTAGWTGGFGITYWVGCIVFALMLIYQHHIVKPDDLSRINLAFFTANGIASVIFSIFVIADIFS